MSFEDKALSILTNQGLSGEKIPTVPGVKTPDFLVRCAKYAYLIELKERFPDPQVAEDREQRLKAGELVEEADEMGYRNAISSIVGDAVGQLISDAAPQADFRVCWLQCQGYFAEKQAEQVIATLFGVADITDWEGDDGFHGNAFYYDESEFFRYRSSLDGAIVSFEEFGVFCLNDHSENYSKLRSSGLRKCFSGVEDPNEMENTKSRIVIRSDIDRRDGQAMIHLLKTEYGMGKPMKMNMKHYSATILAPQS